MSERIRYSNYEYASTYAKKKQQENRIEITQVNFMIIREVFNAIKDNRTSNSIFWMYLLDMEIPENKKIDKKQAKRAEAIFTALINSGNGDYKLHAKKLIMYGISQEYFSEQFIEADKNIISAFKDHCSDVNKISLEECRKILIKNIFSIKNLDGTLVIDCIRNMLMDLYNISEPTYNLAEQIVSKKATTHISQNKMIEYYKNTVKDFKTKINMESDPYHIPELPEGKVPEKKIYTAFSNKGSLTLLLIRETYALLASMNGINDYMKNFYSFIGISEADYQKLIDTTDIPNKKLLQIFEPYKYPASLFRGENPTDINICSEIKEAYDFYRNEHEPDFDIECFRIYLKVYLCYKISTENINLIIPTCALIEDMFDKLPYTNFLSPDELALCNSIQLAERISSSDI